MNNTLGSCPLVTVVTLTYKHFEHLENTILSVFRQDYPRIEYIICDDGSTFFPEEMIAEIIAKCPNNIKVEIIRNKENQGTVRNINIAYRKSKGDYIMNLSAGDVFFAKDIITKVVKTFQTTSCGVLSTTRILYYNDFIPVCMLPHFYDRKTIKKWDSCKKQYEAFISSSFLNMASGSSMYMKRTVIEDFGFFDEKYVLWEDGPFIEKYLRENTIEQAFDIVSIWYESGGVSNGGANSLLKKDADLFHKTDRIRFLNQLSFWNKRKIKYRINSFYAKNRFERMMYKVFDMPMFFYFSLQLMRSQLNSHLDKKEIRKIIYDEKKRDSLIVF